MMPYGEQWLLFICLSLFYVLATSKVIPVQAVVTHMQLRAARSRWMKRFWLR